MSSDKPEEPAAYSSLYFDPLNADEESIHEIDPEIQERIRKIEEIYQSLIPTKVQDMAYEKSMIERTKLKIKHDDTFVYGEMTFRTFAYIIEVIKASFGENCFNQGNFYDLGCGHGHLCVQAALLHPFHTCVGYELLSQLYKMCIENKINYDKNMKAILQANKGLFPHHRNVPNLNFVKGNLLQYDWTRGSVVFTNATCFNAEIMKNIYNKAILLPKGSFFINTTLSMPKEYRKNFIALTPFDRMMSWGKAKIYIFRKK